MAQGSTYNPDRKRRPGRHAKKPNKHKAQATRKTYRGQGRR